MKRTVLVEVAAVAALLALPVSAATPGQPPASTRPGEAWRQAPRLVVVKPAAAPSSPARSVPIISLSVKDADLVEVVRSLARIAGINVIFDPGVSGKVTAELASVRWDHALAVILKTQGFGMELDGRILAVASPSRLAGSR